MRVQDEGQVLVEQGLDEEQGQVQEQGLHEEQGQESEPQQTVRAIHITIRLGQNRSSVPFIYTYTNL